VNNRNKKTRFAEIGETNAAATNNGRAKDFPDALKGERKRSPIHGG